MSEIFRVKDFHAAGDGRTLDTKAIQAAIDAAGRAQGTVVLGAGTYLTGSLFLRSHMEFRFEEGAILLGTTDEDCYPMVLSRVAGIEMEWPAAVLNLRDLEDVKVTGNGTINGQGEYWWNKYWGEDQKGGIRKTYDARGLRWAADYDCMRPRNVLVYHCKDVTLSGFQSVRSAFWNVHVCYSRNVHVDGLWIHDNEGPSTDGIDIDSCSGVLVEHCSVACNDDSICIKSGRDADGLRVNRVCEDVTVQDCQILSGCGVTIGSETSGGAKNITIRNLEYNGTDCGFRMKSARTRGGVIQDILVENLKMVNVKYPFHMDLNWHPLYSYCAVPKDYDGEIPPHWKVLTQPVSPEQGIPKVKNVTIRNVTSVNTPDYTGISRAFEVAAYEERPMEHVVLERVRIEAKEFGRVEAVKDWQWKDVEVTIRSGNDTGHDEYDVR